MMAFWFGLGCLVGVCAFAVVAIYLPRVWFEQVEDVASE